MFYQRQLGGHPCVSLPDCVRLRVCVFAGVFGLEGGRQGHSEGACPLRALSGGRKGGGR